VSLHKKLFNLLIFLIPLNLGKHFIMNVSYVKGLLIDYLIPTIYLQDIIVLLIIGLYIYDYFNKSKGTLKSLLQSVFNKRLLWPSLFIFAVFLSTLVSTIFVISVYGFVRLFLYYLLFLYIVNTLDLKKDLSNILKMFVTSMALVSVLGLFQLFLHGSVFNNYLFFGEQPYSFSTKGISLENVFGYTVVPAYGLFRHPNIFGGLLSLCLLVVYSKLNISKGYTFLFLLLASALLVTFSWLSMATFVVSVILYSYFISKDINKKYLTVALTILLVLFSVAPLVASNFSFLSSNVSLLRRTNLLSGSFDLLRNNLMYGVGINTFTNYIGSYLFDMGAIRFDQPVHNMYVLILSETGVIAFVLFLFFIVSSVYKSLKEPLLAILLFQMLLLACFDHYFWTIHQPQLLFWIILGLCWTIEDNY
jgi:O-antigen ligase